MVAKNGNTYISETTIIPYRQLEESVNKRLQQRPTTKNSVEIPMANLGFATIPSLKKLSPGDR